MENFKFFSHRSCEFFPCHETKEPERFNCLFCYCPLYSLGADCGGNFKYLENGVKSCEDCLLPHCPESYEYILSRYPDLAKLAADHEKKTLDG